LPSREMKHGPMPGKEKNKGSEKREGSNTETRVGRGKERGNGTGLSMIIEPEPVPHLGNEFRKKELKKREAVQGQENGRNIRAGNRKRMGH